MNLRKYSKTWISSAHQGFVEPGMASNTLAAFALAARKGADMIETDARMTRDGVLIANHDPVVHSFDGTGHPVTPTITETDYADLAALCLTADGRAENRVPTLASVLSLAYFTGMAVNIDLKEGMAHAADIARLVMAHGMGGRTVYATNGAGMPAIRTVLAIDPAARFIDTKRNFTRDALAALPDYPARCFVYTGDFSDENIAEIRESGCKLAAISLHAGNSPAAFRHHPDMAEYPHTSDFAQIDREILDRFASSFQI